MLTLSRYNNLFPSNAHTLGARSNGTGGWAQNRLWPGPSHTLKLKNGTVITVETQAELLTPLTHFPWRDGPSLYDKLCVDGNNATKNFTTTPESIGSAKKMPLEGYPEPFTRSEGDEITGYLPDHPALKDVAVLSVPTFGTIYAKSFSRAAKDLIKNATAQGRSKMIIDISSNSGGAITSSLDLFKMFFPEKLPYTASRYRAHHGLNLLGKISLNGDSDDGIIERDLQYINRAGEAVTPDLEHNITSWQRLYGPHKTVGMNSTTLISTTNTKLLSTERSPISGYGPIPLDPKTAPFKAEDIVLVWFRVHKITFRTLLTSLGLRRHVRFGLRHVRRAHARTKRQEYCLWRPAPEGRNANHRCREGWHWFQSYRSVAPGHSVL